ncbi:hypothetical protein F4778DRAFT_724661 [Xylariomycetidae sp. FL2044]|nr:hypothetical protein F4778DRAFT_724661 [Xylariomycetidae sp. FL2044]
MADTDMRLRLVVRRNGLPEARLMWNVRLEDDPTISKLLELLNEDIPLESEQWGLEDYIVELRDSDGSAFECLHFQPVHTVLKPDDRVFIRALDRDDTRRRRVSGRLQISTDGKHLVDGVPFGRTRLRLPTGRPPIHIPPRKKPRLTYDDSDPSDRISSPSPLLLTAGPFEDRDQSSPDLPDVDLDDADDGDFDSEAQRDGSSDDSESDDDEVELGSHDASDDDELQQEAEDLAQEAGVALKDDKPRPAPPGLAKSAQTQTLDLSAVDKISALRAAFPLAPIDICEKVLMAHRGDLKKSYGDMAEGFPPRLSEAALLTWPATTGPTLQKTADNAGNANAGSMAVDQSEEIGPEEESEQDEQPSALVRRYDYRGLPPGSITSGKGLAQMAAISGSFASSKVSGDSEATSATIVASKISPEKISAAEDDTSSSESSLDGTSSSSSSESEDNSDVEVSDEEDSKEHSEEDSEADSEMDREEDDAKGGEEDDESDEEDGESNVSGGPDGHTRSNSKSDEESDRENDSDSDSDSGPEETSSKSKLALDGLGLNRRKTAQVDDSDHVSSSSSDSDSDPNSPEHSSDEDSEASESSSASESESESESSDSEIEKSEKNFSTLGQGVKVTASEDPPAVSLPKLSMSSRTPSVPPGAGKPSTKSRNARRKAAKKARKQQAEAECTNVVEENVSSGLLPTHVDQKSPDVQDAQREEKALFEAKRNALLEAIANGGVDVTGGRRAGIGSDVSSTESSSVQRKRKSPDAPTDTHDETLPGDKPTDRTVKPPSNSPKRRRMDLGAGRRLLFGALGLRNPKTKEDEDGLRDKLMTGVRPLTNARLEKQTGEGTRQPEEEEPGGQDEDPDAWKDKIVYRAVECCQEGVELSEPPFPFAQRWDPQQQGSGYHKKNKRGGQSKRNQRNEAHYYQEARGKKRSFDESADWSAGGYDTTGDYDTTRGYETTKGYDATGGYDTTFDGTHLNYDDPETGDGTGNGTSNDRSNDNNTADQTTDPDDLPALPQDLTALPALRPGEVQAGMVITWGKWSCSSATNWQPQVSRVTGVVVRVDDDATGLEVCLAKRDRHLDGNEKRFDHATGQRVYGRFEAPDLDEDEDVVEDEGYRTLSFAEMQDPRILQQPLSMMEVDDTPQDIPDVTNVSGEAVDPTEAGLVQEGSSGSSSHASGQGQQDANPSVSSLSQVSSPSRQLHETTSQAVAPFSQESGNDKDREDDDARGPEEISGQDELKNQQKDPGMEASDSVPAMSSIDGAGSSSLEMFKDSSEVIAGTPRIVRGTIPSSGSSIRSGRQPDFDMSIIEPDSFGVTDDDAVPGVSVILGEDRPASTSEDNNDGSDDDTSADDADTGAEDDADTGAEDDEATPTPKRPTAHRDSEDGNGLPSSPADPSTPGSLSSINTVWHTAVTSRNTQSARNTQSPLKSQQMSSRKSRKTQALRDLEYEQAMRKLEEQSEEDASSLPVMKGNIETQDRSPRLSQASFKLKEESMGDMSLPLGSRAAVDKISPPPRRRNGKPLSKPKFSLPPGTQVLEISSDSEPQFTEHYADDEVDGTYSPRPGSLPKGGGWVQKRADARQAETRRSTAPLTAKGRRSFCASQGRKSISPSSSLPSFGQTRARRKTSARFSSTYGP